MKNAARIAIGALLALLVAVPLAARAQFHLPIPGLGGDIAVKAAAKQLAPYFQSKLPVIRDWSAIYPTAAALPGAPFAPTINAQRQGTVEKSVITQLRNSTTGVVSLAPGDYAIPVRVFCTDVHRHAKSPETYLLGPLRGTRSQLLTSMYANAANSTVPFQALQPLSWSLQEGMKYEQLPGAQQATFNQLLPGKRSWIAESFVQLMQDKWGMISGTIPGVPSFESALGQMGDMGRVIQDAQNAESEILANAADFDSLVRTLVPGGTAEGGSGGETPWGTVSPNVYERLVTQGAFGSVGLLEIRVTGGGKTIVPVTSNVGYAPQCHECQPLTMHPLKGGQPQPALGASVGVFQ